MIDLSQVIGQEKFVGIPNVILYTKGGFDLAVKEELNKAEETFGEAELEAEQAKIIEKWADREKTLTNTVQYIHLGVFKSKDDYGMSKYAVGFSDSPQVSGLFATKISYFTINYDEIKIGDMVVLKLTSMKGERYTRRGELRERRANKFEVTHYPRQLLTAIPEYLKSLEDSFTAISKLNIDEDTDDKSILTAGRAGVELVEYVAESGIPILENEVEKLIAVKGSIAQIAN